MKKSIVHVLAVLLVCSASVPSTAADAPYSESLRPQFHFTARTNWLNDPNGLVFYRGEYHLFFQHNPTGIKWGNMHWGHAVSPDLVHWAELPVALKPDELGTMFSGSAVVDWNNTAGLQKGDEPALVAVYTAAGGTSEQSKGKRFTQCIAYSTDRGRAWTKYEKNPVLGHVAGDNRDPKVIWHAPTKRWVMALYKEKNDFAFFASPDLKNWTSLQDVTVPGCDECPDFFPLAVDGDKSKTKWVWTAANGRYLVGDFDGQKFTPGNPDGRPYRVDYGKNFYAVQTYSDVPESDGRRIQVAWMRDGKYPGMPFNQQMSFPCVLALRTLPEGVRLTRTPVAEVESLHAKEQTERDIPLPRGAKVRVGEFGELLDIRADIERGDAAEVGLSIRGEAVTWSAKDKTLSALGASAPLELPDGRLRLQILVDRTSLEVFANFGRVSLTSCFLPRPGDKELTLFARGGDAKVTSLTVYELRSAWPAAAAKSHPANQ